MTRVLIKASSQKQRLQDIVGYEGRLESDLASCLLVSDIEVEPHEGVWTVKLDIDDEAAWKKSSSCITKTQFDFILLNASQELRNQVRQLSSVNWVIPEEFSKGFKKVEEVPAKKERAYNRSIDESQAIPLKDINGTEKGRLTVCGKISSVSWRRQKGNRTDGTLIITDGEDSLRLRLSGLEDKDDSLKPQVKIICQGRVGLDRFDEEPVLFVNKNSLYTLEPTIREDLYKEKRVELHLHTKMSQLDSVLDLEKAFQRAKAWGHPALAVTDHGVVQAFPEAYALSKKYGVRLIYGLEGYLVEDDEPKGRAHHIIILAKNKAGLRNLYELVTLSHIEHFYRTPRIPRGLLAEKREGLLLGSACEAGEVFRSILEGEDDDRLRELAGFYDYLEIQPFDNNSFLLEKGILPDKEALFKINKKIYSLAKETGKMCVMTSDCHYVDEEDEIHRAILLSVKGMDGGENPARLYYRTTQEMIEEAQSYLGADRAHEVVVTNTNLIADSIEDMAPVPQGSFFPKLPDADTILKELAEIGAHDWYGDPLPKIVSSRLKKELDAIIGNGFSSLYLIAIKMVEKSLSDGYVVGSRGSVGSSFVATMTGITEVNPLKPHYVCPHCRFSEFLDDYSSGFDLPEKTCPTCGAILKRDGQDIPFETFMGFQGEKVPDIDLNFSGDEQGEIFKFSTELLGEKNVFRAGTIGTIARKTAFGFVKHYQEEKGSILRRAHETTLCAGIEGVKRTTGQHPGGVMVVPDGLDILDFTPLQYPADDKKSEQVTTHFDYNSISGHLVKVDILGHDDPTVLKMLKDLTGVDPISAPMDDPETLRLFNGEDGDAAVGIPEFGTRFVRQMLTETHPQCFADLVRISGLSHGTDVWANNARDLIKDGTATLSEVIATREDIFLYLMRMGVDAAISFRIAEKVRKGQPLSEGDVKIMVENKVPDWYIDSCRKISYLFPKAHAAAYVTTAFRIAYFKVHYPVAFGAAYFSFHGSALTTDFLYLPEAEWREYVDRVYSSQRSRGKEQDVASALEVAIELSKRGVMFGKPSLYSSLAKRYIAKGSTLIPPLTSIPGLGEKAAQAIVEARAEGEFSSIEDFRRRTRLGKKLCESLKEHDFFEGLTDSDQLSLFG